MLEKQQMVLPHRYSRREREIMDILHQRGRASAREVMDALASPPSYSAVRATLRVMVDKGHIREDRRKRPHEYRPAVSTRHAGAKALRHYVDTFFSGKTDDAVAALLDSSASQLTNEQLDRLQRLVDAAKAEASQ